jgi:DNA-binding winged helix-turn-helix (wHTH) protein/TolB-like protein
MTGDRLSSQVEPSQSEAVEYRFEDVRVDTRARRVFKAGSELALEPKAYGVLLALLAEPNIAIERDRLLDTVWGHRHVTPAVLNRVIAMLRRALGDDAEHPRLIRTVHGVGYSFIGVLAEAAVAAPDSEARTGESLSGPAAQVPGAIPSSSVTSAIPRQRRTLITAIAAIVAVTGTAMLLTRLPGPSQPPNRGADAVTAPNRTQAPVHARLALLPISAGNTNDPILARGLTELLSDALVRVAKFEVTGLTSAQTANESSDDARDLGRMLGTDHLLRGTLAAQADAVTLDLQLVAARDGAVIWAQTFTRSREHLHEVLAPTVDGLRAALLPSGDDSGNGATLYASAPAMSLYWDAERVVPNTPAARAEQRALLERAVAADPQFALGWAALAEVELDRYTFSQASLTEAVAAANAAANRALAIDPDLIEALTSKAGILTMQWRSAEALGVSRRALELAPNSVLAISTRANVLCFMGRPRESLLLRQRAVALDPLSPWVIQKMSTDYLTLGLRDQALEAIALAGRVRKDKVPMREGRIEMAFGNIANSIAGATRSLAGNKAQALSHYETFSLARAWSLMGEHAKAEIVLSSATAMLPETPVYLETWLTVHWARGEYAQAVRWLDNEGRHAAQEPWQHAASAHARALAGDSAGALADYALALDARADRDLIASTWFPGRFGMAPLANWIALRKALGLPYAAELDDYAQRLDEAIAGGTALPLIDYHRAALAALRDDTATADRLLTTALERGWVDPLALDIDLTWRAFTQSEWLTRQRSAQAGRIEQERKRLRQLQSP